MPSSSESRVAEALAAAGVPMHPHGDLFTEFGRKCYRENIATDRAAILRCLLSERIAEIEKRTGPPHRVAFLMDTGNTVSLESDLLLATLAPESPDA